MSKFMLTGGAAMTLPSFTEDYSGCMYAVRFCVSNPLMLTHIGFFGPSTEDSKGKPLPLFAGENGLKKVNIKINLEVKESFYADCSIPDSCLETYFKRGAFCGELPLDGPKGKFFLLRFPKSFAIPANKFIEIRFELCPEAKAKGLRFYRLGDPHPTYEVMEHPESGVTFTFLNSSKQLASIVFDTMAAPAPVGPPAPGQARVVEEPARSAPEEIEATGQAAQGVLVAQPGWI